MLGLRLVYPALTLIAVIHAQTADRLKALPPFPAPFYGKWRLVVDSTPPMAFKRDGDMIEGAVAGRTYRFKIDGQDYSKPGDGQTAAWRRTGPRAYETVVKKNGAVISTTTFEVAPDGKTARFSAASATGPAPTQSVFTRKSAADPEEPLLGSWEIDSPVDTITDAPNGIHWTSTSGLDFSAGFDSREYPVTGASPVTSVSIQKIDDRTLEETRKAGSAVVAKSRIELSEDGGTMKRTTTDLRQSNAAPLVTQWLKEK